MTVKNDGTRDSFNKKGLLYSGISTGLSCTVFVLLSLCEYIPIYGPEIKKSGKLFSVEKKNKLWRFAGCATRYLFIKPDRI